MDPQAISYHKTNLSISLLPDMSFNNILVVGCGEGIEVFCLSDRYRDAKIIGIDPSLAGDRNEKNISLSRIDATKMPFADESFDLVYSYHVLEHIPDYNAALSEMQRVLKPGGHLLLGTPNRDRIIGYVSSATSLRKKIKWNIDDWKMKIRGKFRNEFGAHAGYTNQELGSILKQYFPIVEEVSKKYYQLLHKRQILIMNLLYKLRLARWLTPAVYFIAKKI